METKQEKSMNLSELCNGALQEVFDYEFQKVMKNIKDVNTDPKIARKVTIELSLKPDESRTVASVDFKVKHSEAPINGFSTSILMKEEGRQITVTELGDQLVGQMNIGNVIEIGKEVN